MDKRVDLLNAQATTSIEDYLKLIAGRGPEQSKERSFVRSIPSRRNLFPILLVSITALVIFFGLTPMPSFGLVDTLNEPDQATLAHFRASPNTGDPAPAASIEALPPADVTSLPQSPYEDGFSATHRAVFVIAMIAFFTLAFGHVTRSLDRSSV